MLYFVPASLNRFFVSGSEGPLCLLFSGDSESPPLNLEESTHHSDIAKHPLTAKLLSPYFIILPIKYTVNSNLHFYTRQNDALLRHALIATPYLSNKFMLQKLAESSNYPITVVTPEKIITKKGEEFYKECALPEKYTHGCSECPALSFDRPWDPSKLCLPVRQVGLQEEAYTLVGDYDDFLDNVKLNQTKIGNFVAVGGSMTSDTTASAAIRHVTLCDFHQIPENKNQRKTATQTRKNRDLLQKEICPRCAMFEPSACDACASDLVSCTGYYPYTPNQLNRKVIKQANVPFTDAQIQYLLTHSGVLEKRINRRKYVASLQYHPASTKKPHTLAFALLPIHSEAYPLKRYTTNFKIAKKWLDTYVPSQKNCQVNPTRLPVNIKATLLELLTHSFSPTRRQGWRSTSYPFRYIERLNKESSLFVSYYWGSAKTFLPWNFNVSSLQDVFQVYRHLNLCEKTVSPYHPNSSHQNYNFLY